MPARRVLHLPVPSDVGNGAAVNVDHFDRDSMVELNGTFTATYHIEYSITPAVWHQLGSNITASIAPPLTIPNGAIKMRVRCSAHTSGQPTCLVAGVEM